MVGLHVQLDVEYASDDKLIEAGPLAELLYVRGLCFAKRTLRDGVISHGQLTAVGIGIPSVTKHARRLVEVGAWTATPTGYRITNWLKRNKSAAQVKAEASRKSKDSIAKNHKRWHVDENKSNPTCPLCYPELDHSPDPNQDPARDTTSDSTEEEVEVEAQPEAEAEASLLAGYAAKEIADALTHELGPARTASEQANRNRTIRELSDVGATGPLVHMRCDRYRIRWPEARLTDPALRKWWTSLGDGDDLETPARQAEPRHAPDCPGGCEGDGWISWTDDQHRGYSKACDGTALAARPHLTVIEGESA